jgi:hypothetical protein
LTIFLLPLVKMVGYYQQLLQPTDLSEEDIEFPGGYSGGATPVPIPNTVVKPSSADGTALATRWESRTPPGIDLKAWSTLWIGPFFYSPGVSVKMSGDNGSKDRKRDFVPANDLEKKLARIGGGRTTPLKGFNFLMNSLVIVLVKPSGEGEGGGDKHLCLRGPEGKPLLAMFSSPERVTETMKHHKAYLQAFKMPGWQAVSALPEDRGLVVNPGAPVGFTVMPGELRKIRKRFRLGGG